MNHRLKEGNIMVHTADIELLNKLAEDAERNEALKLDQKDEKGAEYFRGVAAGLRCAAVLAEE